MKKKVLSLSFIALIVILFVACEEDPVQTLTELENSQEIVDENVTAELNVIKVFENVNNFGFNSSGLKSASENDPIVSMDTINMILTLDFTGVSNASGKIVADFSAYPAYAAGISVDVTFVDYSNDGAGIDGQMKLKIEEYVADVKVKFSMKSIGDLTITEGDKSYLWSCDQTVLWEEGFSTLNVSDDDAFIMSGEAVQTIDEVINEMTLEDVKYAPSCKYLMDGILTLTKDKGSDNEMVIECDFGYGGGDCDGLVMLSSGGFTFQIDFEAF